jgi:hypothetical protein
LPTEWIFNGSAYYRSLDSVQYTPSHWEAYHAGSVELGLHGYPRAYTTVYVLNVHPTNIQDPRNYTGGYTVYGSPEYGYVRISTGQPYIKYPVLPDVLNPPYPV